MKGLGKQIDFTEGSIPKKMLIFAMPIFLTNLLQSSYQIIDSLWVGNLLGANALAAVAIASTVIFTILSFIIGINNATLTVLSQYKGARDEIGLKNALNTFVFVLLSLTLVLGFIGFFAADSILSFLGAPGETHQLAKSYLQINFIGIVFLFGYNFIGTILRALGDSRTPLRFVMLAVVLNAVLDPVFIKVFGWGIEGAAIATVFSQGVAFLYGLLYSLRQGAIPFVTPYIPSRGDFLHILKLGLPSGLSMMTISAGVMAIMSVVASFGENVVAGFGAAQRIDSLIMLPAITLGQAVNSMAGQNIGANKWSRVKSIANYGVLFIFAIGLFISTIAFISAKLLIAAFINEEEAIRFGTDYLKMIAFFYPFLGINFILNGIVRGAGAMVQVLVLNIISFWVLRYPLTYWFAEWFGEAGIAIGIGTSFIISSIFAIGYYYLGRWKQINVIQ